ncbi:MAG: PAS domain S-box protein [Thermodesulfobacteriota bacterium]
MSTNEDRRLRMAALAAGVSFYDWHMQERAFSMDDYAGVAGPVGEKVKMSRRAWEALCHPDDRKRISDAFRPILERKGLPQEVEYRIRNGSTYRWVLDRSSIVGYTNEGSPCRVSGIIMDISKRKAIEEMQENRNRETMAALQRSESEKSAILLGLRGLITVRYLAPDLRIIWDNTSEVYEPNKFSQATPGGYCYRVVRGQDKPCSSGCTPISAIESGEMKRTEARLDDGRAFIEVSSPVRDNAGALLGVIFIALNITQHKQIEARLHATDRSLQSFLENSPTPIAVFDEYGRIDLVNPAWERLVGLERDQAVGQRLDDVFKSGLARRIRRSNKEVLRSGMPVELDESIHFPSGLHYLHTVKFPLNDTTGQKDAVGTISVDITARKLAKRELIKQEAELRTKSRQLAETNTALRVLLKQQEGDQRELEERIVANVEQLVLPYVRSLKGMRLNKTQMIYLQMVEAHLQDIVAPFLRHVVSQYPHMTAKEIQVATLVRDGKSNKDIADLMNLAVNTVEIHRHNLRKKLGLQNKKVNLRSYLLSLNGGRKSHKTEADGSAI